jgi:hypothetical protein
MVRLNVYILEGRCRPKCRVPAAFGMAVSPQAWKDMDLEILHELQEGAIEDVPDVQVDSIGNLVVLLKSWRDKNRPKSEDASCLTAPIFAGVTMYEP